MGNHFRQRFRLQIGEAQKRRPAANQAVAMRDFFYDRLGKRTPAAHVEQKFGNILKLIRSAMGQKQYSPTFRERGLNGFFLHHVAIRILSLWSQR